jgi:hypothetical protein
MQGLYFLLSTSQGTYRAYILCQATVTYQVNQVTYPVTYEETYKTYYRKARRAKYWWCGRIFTADPQVSRCREEGTSTPVATDQTAARGDPIRLRTK